MKTSKNMTNLELARLFRAVAAALELTEGDNRFRVMAYERAADAIEHSSSEIKDLWDNHELDTLAGIGPNITDHLDELFTTGKVKHFQSILKPFPDGLFELIEVPGIGPKTAIRLCKALGIAKAHTALSRLEKAAKSGHIRSLEGFGVDSEQDILKSLSDFRNRSHRMLLPKAQSLAEEIISWMKKIPQVKEIFPLGSLRRQASTVGDIDLAVASDTPNQILQHFTSYPGRKRVLEAGDKTASIVLKNGIQVDLMVQPPDSFGSLLQHFTGSKHHNILLREYALKKGLSLSEYGIKSKSRIKTFATEEKFYGYLGLDYIPPELREGGDEINLAKNHSLPELISLSDIHGDLQIHSNLNVEPSHDLGVSSLDEISREAKRLGYEYIGLTEHNPSVSGHTPKQVYEIIKRKSEIIKSYNEKLHEKGVPYVFNGLEIDIQTDGRRALPDSCLDLLDYACVSVHSAFRQKSKQMTDRILHALDHPKVLFLAHPTARLLGEREGIELDWDRLFEFCQIHSKWLEIDGWPNRLDLPDVLVRQAVKGGIKLVADTDSHSAADLVHMRYAISVARRGGARVSDIVNTVSLTDMRKLIFQRR